METYLNVDFCALFISGVKKEVLCNLINDFFD